MNLLHLKYVVEISKTKSINKAAENLYMAQPNLSRAIKELEDSLGTYIFNRTSKGMELTEKGEEFVKYAEKILKEIEQIEYTFTNRKQNTQEFSLSSTRASYVSVAFNNFIKNIKAESVVKFNYKETNNMRVIKNVAENSFSLGIIRYSTSHEQLFESLLFEKGIDKKEIFNYKLKLLTQKGSALCALSTVSRQDLKDYIEVAFGDPYVPTFSIKEAKSSALSGATENNILVCDRASLIESVSMLSHSFAFTSPIPQFVLDKYNLVQLECEDFNKTYKDVLIYKKNYQLSKLDNMFLEDLNLVKDQILTETQK